MDSNIKNGILAINFEYWKPIENRKETSKGFTICFTLQSEEVLNKFDRLISKARLYYNSFQSIQFSSFVF